MLAFCVGLSFTVLIFNGIRKGPKSLNDQITLFILGAVAVQFLFWPYYLGARSGIAIIPFLLIWIGRGFPSSRMAKLMISAFLIVNIPGNAWLSAKFTLALQQTSTDSLASLQQAASWINENGGESAIVAAGRDVPLLHLYEYLGRRMLANASPIGEGKYVDVNPSAQGNQWANYLVIDPSFDPSAWAQVKNRYAVRRVFGRWIVASPLR